MRSLINTLLLALLLFSTSKNAVSQALKTNPVSPKTIPNSFVIHGTFDAEVLEFYTQSIESADFEQYRLKDAAVELKFKNGFVLELISAKDLTIKNKMQNVNPNVYPDKISISSTYNYPLFEILKSGWITAEVQPTVIKKNK